MYTRESYSDRNRSPVILFGQRIVKSEEDPHENLSDVPDLCPWILLLT